MSLVEADDDDLRELTLQSFTGSALFERTFDEGMSLVAETSRYLDGPGRQEARELPRRAAMLYAGESLRVTTRLMQAVSWLLVQRAVHEGDMEPELASSDRYRLGSKEICFADRPDGADELPAMLQDLLTRSDQLYRRIARLDDVLFRKDGAPQGARAHIDRLTKVFENDDENQN